MNNRFIGLNEANSSSSHSGLTRRQKPGISSGADNAVEEARQYGTNRPTNPFIQMRIEEVEQSIAQRFERIAAQYPERIAVKVNCGETLTYDILNQRANRLARAILACRGDNEEPIPLASQP